MALKRSCSKNSRRRSDSEAIGRIVHVYSILHAVLHVSCGVYQKHPKTLLFVERWLPGVLVVKSFHVETRGEEGTVWWGQPLVPVKLGDVFNARRSMVAKIGSIQKKKEKTSNKAPNGDFLLTRNPLGIARPVFVPTDLPALTSIAGGSYLTDE